MVLRIEVLWDVVLCLREPLTKTHCLFSQKASIHHDWVHYKIGGRYWCVFKPVTDQVLGICIHHKLGQHQIILKWKHKFHLGVSVNLLHLQELCVKRNICVQHINVTYFTLVYQTEELSYMEQNSISLKKTDHLLGGNIKPRRT